MPKFLQYDIDNIQPILREFVKLLTNKQYTNNELTRIYSRIKSYETSKTKQVFQNIILRILFGIIKKGKEKTMNAFGLLLKAEPDNDKLVNELIYVDLYRNTDIFRIECDFLSNYVARRGPISYSEESFKDFLFSRVERVLEESEEYKENIENAKKKIFRTIKNLRILGVIKEIDDSLYMGNYIPDWRLVSVMLVNEFESKKIIIKDIFKSEFKRCLFISDYDLDQILEKLQIEDIIKIERRAGLNQINVNFSDPIELVRSFQ